MLPLPPSQDLGQIPKPLRKVSQWRGAGQANADGAVSHGQPPSPAQPCHGVGKGFFPDNQIYKALLVPGKWSPRADRSKFLSAPSAARHPENIHALLNEAKTPDSVRAGGWQSQELRPTRLMPCLGQKWGQLHLDSSAHPSSLQYVF